MKPRRTALEVVAWGSGSPRRGFYVDDVARASIFVMNIAKQAYRLSTEDMLSHINVGTGVDCSIKN